MTTISTDARLTTLVNVFTVQPDQQKALVDVLVRATDEVIRHVPGFISANIHTSLDGIRVVNYAQWESAEAYRAMLDNPAAQEHMREAANLADTFEPHLYDVTSVHHR
jgi:quinol monooxygenase YgiN